MKKIVESIVVLGLLFVMIWAAPTASKYTPHVVGVIASSTPAALPLAESADSRVVQSESALDSSDFFLVKKVVDGDTVVLAMNGIDETVRLIGVNTPETVDPRKPVECFGKEASEAAKKLLTGKSVKFAFDPTQDSRDKYGRLLGYLYLEDGTLVNEYLIREGFAYEYTYKIPYEFQDRFKKAEAIAKESLRGLWGEGACQKTEKVEPDQASSTPPLIKDGYSCSANLYNCADFRTQAEAQSVFIGCGGPGKDIHKLDVDKDGIVCESLIK